jgi:hypothetical protein
MEQGAGSKEREQQSEIRRVESISEQETLPNFTGSAIPERQRRILVSAIPYEQQILPLRLSK